MSRLLFRGMEVGRLNHTMERAYLPIWRVRADLEIEIALGKVYPCQPLLPPRLPAVDLSDSKNRRVRSLSQERPSRLPPPRVSQTWANSPSP